ELLHRPPAHVFVSAEPPVGQPLRPDVGLLGLTAHPTNSRRTEVSRTTVRPFANRGRSSPFRQPRGAVRGAASQRSVIPPERRRRSHGQTSRAAADASAWRGAGTLRRPTKATTAAARS